MTAPRIAVVGGGIGGLTLALALRDVGLDSVVYEAAPELREVGAGLQIGPNASRVLHHLGLADPLDAVAVRPATGDLRRWEDASILTSQPLGDTVLDAYGSPYLHLHRVDLHMVLIDAVGADRVALDKRCTGVEERRDGVHLSFSDGTTVVADMVVGADGIHSTVRSELHGPERPRFSGGAAWRGLVPAESVAHLDGGAGFRIF